MNKGEISFKPNSKCLKDNSSKRQNEDILKYEPFCRKLSQVYLFVFLKRKEKKGRCGIQESNYGNEGKTRVTTLPEARKRDRREQEGKGPGKGNLQDTK